MTAVVHAGDLMTGAARRRMIVVLGALTALGPFTIDLYVPAFPQVADSLGATASAVQITLAGTTMGIAVGQLVMGPWSDRVGRRLPLILATTAHVLASLLCAVAPDVIFLTIARFSMGAAAAAGGVVAAAMVRDLYSGIPMMRLASRLAMINGAAPIVAPVLGSVLLAWTNWRGIFVVLALYAVIIVISTALFIPESLPVESRATGGARATGLVAAELFRDREYVVLMISGGLVWGSQFAFIAGSPFLLQDHFGLTTAQFGVAYALAAAGYVAGTQVGARVAHRIPPDRLLAAATCVMTIASSIAIVCVLVDARVGVYIALCFSVAAVGIAVPCSSALALNRVQRGMGTAAAILGAANFGLAALVTPLAGVSVGPPGLAMTVTMLLCGAIAAVLTVRLARRGDVWQHS